MNNPFRLRGIGITIWLLFLFAPALVLADEVAESEKIDIKLDYKSDSLFDRDDDGIETKEGVIDLTVEGSDFSWQEDEGNLCTRWTIMSQDSNNATSVCYGSDTCCSFIDLAPLRDDWDEVFYSTYGQLGATGNNTLSAQIMYVDYNLTQENPSVEILTSDVAILPIFFVDPIVTFITKITRGVSDRINLIKGAIVEFEGTLQLMNNSPLKSRQIGFYSNYELIGTKETNSTGQVHFEWNSSEANYTEYHFSLNYSGDSDTVGLQVIESTPSSSVTLVSVLQNESQILLPIQEHKAGNFNFLNKQDPWIVLSKDDISQYISFEFKYLNDSRYRVDWEWNDMFIRELLYACTEAINETLCIQNSYEKYRPQKIEQKINGRWTKEIQQSHILELNSPPTLASSRPISEYSLETVTEESGVTGIPLEIELSAEISPKATINDISSSFFDNKSFSTIKSSVVYMKEHGMSRSVLKNDISFIGEFNPFSSTQGSFIIDLQNGFYSSNGAIIKIGQNSTIITFNNSQSAENLIFSETGTKTRYLRVRKDANLTSATFIIEGKVHNSSGSVSSNACTGFSSNFESGPSPSSGAAEVLVPSTCNIGFSCSGGDTCYCGSCNYTIGIYQAIHEVCPVSGFYVNACSSCASSSPPSQSMPNPQSGVSQCTGSTRDWDGGYGANTLFRSSHGGGDSGIQSQYSSINVAYAATTVWGWYPDHVNITLANSTLYYQSSNLDGTAQVTNFSSTLRSYLSTCSPDQNGYCNVPIDFTSAGLGTITYSNINLLFDLPPTFTMNTSDNSNILNTTRRGNNVIFTSNISEEENDQVKFIICDSQGRYGVGCYGLQYCSYGFDTQGVKSCTLNTTNLTGVEHNWTSFACDNSSLCTIGSTGSFYIERPLDLSLYVNGSRIWNTSGLLNSPQLIENFSAGLQNDIDACFPINNSCNISLTFSSESPGVLELSLLDVQYRYYDREPPLIHSILVSPNPVPLNYTINLTINVTDNANVTAVIASHKETMVNLIFNHTTKLWRGSLLSPSTIGIYQLNITAIDSSNLTTINSSSTAGSSSNGTGSSCSGFCVQSSGLGGNSTKAELYTANGDIVLSSPSPLEGETLFIKSTVYNLGGGTANNFITTLKIDGAVITNTTISLGVQSSSIVQFEWNATAGNHTLEIVSDYTSIINEDDNANNIGALNFTVEDTTPPTFIGLSTQRGSLIVKLNVSDNIGISNITAIVDTVFMQFGFNATSSLWEGRTELLNAGTYPISISITDTSGLVTTVRSIITVYMEAIDLTLTRGDLIVSPEFPIDGEEVRISVNVHNFGKNLSSNFTIGLLIDNNLLGNTTLTVPGDSNSTAQFNWTAIYGAHNITARIDSGSSILEINESNNELSRSLTVSDGNPPIINHVFIPEIIYEFGNFTFRANVTDNVGIYSVNLTLNDSVHPLIFNAVNGLFEAAFVLPTSSIYPLSIISVDQSSLSSTFSQDIQIYDTLSDITSNTGSFHLEPENANESDDLNFSISILNLGGSDTAEFSVSWYIDDIFQHNSTLSLVKASVESSYFEWIATYGYHNISIELDSGNEITESNESNNLRSYSFFVADTIPPTAPTVLSNPPGWTNSTVINISWSDSIDQNGISYYEYFTGQSDWIFIGLNSSVLLNLTSEGSHLIFVRATDSSGNKGEIGNTTSYIDLTGPNTPEITEWQIGSNWSSQNAPYLTWNDPGDKGSGVIRYEISIDNGIGINVGQNLSYQSPNLSSGSHTLKIEAFDALNRSSNWSNVITLFIDSSLPDPPLVISPTNPTADWFNVNTPVFNLTLLVNDSEIEGYYYLVNKENNSSLDKFAFWTFNSTLNLSSLGGPTQAYENGTNESQEGVPDGEWYIHIVGEDSAGNLGLNATHYQFRIDTQAPVLQNISPGNNSISSNMTPLITASFTDFGSGVNASNSRFYIDGAPLNATFNSSFASFTPSSNLSPGLHILTLSLSDNISNSQNYSWQLNVGDLSLAIPYINVLDSQETLKTFEFLINNTGDVTAYNVTWQFDTNDSVIINSTEYFDLASGESMLVYLAHNFSSLGNFSVRATANASTASFIKLFSLEIERPSDLDVRNFSIIYSNQSLKTYEFGISNIGESNLSGINWSFVTGISTIHANSLMSLAVNETAFVYVQVNYSQTGDFNVSASATDGTNYDAEYLLVDIEDIEIRNFSILSANSTYHIFEMIIENTLNTNLSNVNWSLDTKNGNIINSTIPISLEPNERIFTYIAYNFTSTGTFNVNATASNGTLMDSYNLNIII